MGKAKLSMSGELHGLYEHRYNCTNRGMQTMDPDAKVPIAQALACTILT